MPGRISKSVVIEYICVSLFSLAIFFPIFNTIIKDRTTYSDFDIHTGWARDIVEAPQEIPGYIMVHSAWQWAVVGAQAVFGNTWRSAALVVTMISVVFTVGILYWLLRKRTSAWLAGLLTIGLMIVAPLAFLYSVDQKFYLGYIGINTYHNPTILLLRPFAILQLFISAEILQGKKAGWKSVVAAFIISAAAAFSKPSYAICLLPALGLLTLFNIWKKKPVDWTRLLIGIVLPTAAFLVWQFIVAYSGKGGGTIISPLGAMHALSGYIPLKFALSILFPVVVTLVFWKDAIKDIYMQLGWVGFGMGAVFTYFFAESGSRFTHGNFIWSGIISLFILFVCCVLFLIEKKHPVKFNFSWSLIIISGFLHVIFGIYYYVVVLTTLQWI